MRIHVLLPITLILSGLILAAPAMASSYGVSLSASGGAGDACQLAPQIAAEGFNSGSLTGISSLTYSGSAVGYNNSAPNPSGSGSGCVYSPVYANVAADGTVALGVIKEDVSADMTSSLVSASARITESWNDTFTSTSGGTYLIDFTLNALDGATPSCPGGPLTGIQFSNQTLAQGYQSIANWNYSDCNIATESPYLYGATTLLNPDTAQMTITVGAHGSFTVSSSLMISAAAGDNQSSFVDAADTAYVDVIGENGATYSSASGVTYDYVDTTPEPASSLLIGCGLVVCGLVALPLRRRRNAALQRA